MKGQAGSSENGDHSTSKSKNSRVVKQPSTILRGGLQLPNSAPKRPDVGAGSGVCQPPSRYINSLLTRATRRRLEQDIVRERQLQKAKESTEEPSETFVTRSYQARLEERQKLELELQRQEAREAKTKKRDLATFYRHMLASEQLSNKRRNAARTNNEANVNVIDNKNRKSLSTEAAVAAELGLKPTSV